MVKLKKIIIMLILCVVMFIPIRTMGDTNELNVETLSENSDDFNEITRLKDEIYTHINSFYTLPADYDINIGDAVKVYVDTDVFAVNSSDATDVISYLQEGAYVWVLYVTVDNHVFEVDISKGLPVSPESESVFTEEELQKIQEQVGKWQIVAIYNKAEDYREKIKNMLEQQNYPVDTEVVICGGLPHIHYPAALVMKDGKVNQIMFLEDVPVNGTQEQLTRITPYNVDANDRVYYYESIKNAVNSMPDEEEDTWGGGGVDLPTDETDKTSEVDTESISASTDAATDNRGYIVVGVAVLIVLAAGAVIFFIKR